MKIFMNAVMQSLLNDHEGRSNCFTPSKRTRNTVTSPNSDQNWNLMQFWWFPFRMFRSPDEYGWRDYGDYLPARRSDSIRHMGHEGRISFESVRKTHCIQRRPQNSTRVIW